MSSYRPDINTPTAGSWRLTRKIGAGSFGEIYRAHNIDSLEEVAVKLEKKSAKAPQLSYEAKVYRMIHNSMSDRISKEGIPKLHWFGAQGEYNAMAIDLLGPSLEDLFNLCSRKFSLKSVLMLADQLLHRIESIHRMCILHRDVKPDNFLMGTSTKQNMVYIVDFGLAKKYRCHRTHQHIPFREGKKLTGTARYASLNTHEGLEQGRRDDLESLGYMLIYFNRGSLPWQGLRAQTKREKYQRIRNRKKRITIEDLCDGQPKEFVEYLNYCRRLNFDDRPDYSYLRKIFRELYYQMGYSDDGVYDWSDFNNQNTNSNSNNNQTPQPANGNGAGASNAHAVNMDDSRQNETATPATTGGHAGGRVLLTAQALARRGGR